MKENRGIITFGGDRRWLVDRNAADSARSGCNSWPDLQKRTNGSKQDATYRDQDSRLRTMSHAAMVRPRIQRGKSLGSRNAVGSTGYAHGTFFDGGDGGTRTPGPLHAK